MLKVGIGATFLVACLAANAATWQSVSVTDRAKAYIDTSSISRNNNVVSYWQKLVFTTPMKVPNHPSLAYILEKFSIDCEQRKIQGSAIKMYSADGNLQHTEDDDEIKDIVPESTSESSLKMVCKK